jgi:hypothetical protein
VSEVSLGLGTWALEFACTTARRIEIIVRAAGKRLARYRLGPGAYEIGRSASCAIHVENSEVSRVHARLFIGEDQLQIEDLGSSFGTYLQGEQVIGLVAFQPPQTIQVAKAVLGGIRAGDASIIAP